MFTSDFISYNKEITESILSFKICLPEDAGIKKTLANFLLLENMKDSFGEFGEKFRKFILNADMQHPELFSFIAHTVGDDGMKELHEIMEISRYCKRKKFSIVRQNLHQLCNNFSSNKIYMFGKNIEYLEQSKIHSRFLPCNQRWEVRNTKKAAKINGLKSINLIEIEQKNKKVFECYHHNSDKINNILIELKNKYNNLCKMNCAYMATEVKNSIDKIALDLNLQSLGFHRITLNSVAKNLNKICDDNNDIKIHPVTIEMCEYNKVLKNIVDICENFPAFGNGYAAFDHYAVIKSDSANVGIIVGERDMQAFFIGYYYND